MVRHFSLLFFSLLFFSCKGQKEEFVRIIVQPEVEVGNTINININFEQKPDSIIVSEIGIDGLEMTYNLYEISNNISESNTRNEHGEIIKTHYNFENYAIPTKKGRIDFPILTVIYKGREYKSKPFYIDVVENIKINQNDIKIIWVSDKESYKKNDTIKLNLFEYSRFSQTKIKHVSPEKLPIFQGKSHEIHIGVEETIDNIVGINDFEKKIEKNFNGLYFNWNTFKNNQIMEEIDDRLYIKTLIAELHLLAKYEGLLEIGPSKFDITLYKNDRFDLKRRIRNKDGIYVMPKEAEKNIKIQSNNLKILVK